MKNRKKKIVIVVVLVCVLVGVFWACQGAKGSAGQYTEVKVQVKDMSSYLEFSGNVESANSANVYADASAKVTELKVEEGDEVKAGDVLAILDSSNVEYNIRLKEAALKASNTSGYYNVKDSQNALNQYQESLDQGLNTALISAQKALISAQKSYQDAADSYNTAKADYDSGKNNSVVSARQQLASQQASYNNAAQQHEDGFLSDEAFASSQVALANAQENLRLAKEQAEKQIDDYYDAFTQAEQALANAERDYEASLLNVSQSMENYENNIEKAQALSSTETSEIELAHLKESLEDYVIYAPIDGTITTLDLKEGDYATAGNLAVAQIQDFGTMQVAVKIDEQNIGNVHIGDEVSVYINALDRNYEGRISEISKTAVKSNNAVYVEATVEFTADEEVRTGFSAEVKLMKAYAPDALCIPLDAVNYDTDNTAYVYVKGTDGEMKKQSVTLGLSDTSMVQVTEGLSENDTVMQEVKANMMYGMPMNMDMGQSRGGQGAHGDPGKPQE